MNPVQQSQSIPEWQPPSPKTTPQSAKFSGYQFLSPPSSGPSPGFDNAWMTPHGYGYNSAFPTPSMSVGSHGDGPSSATSLKRPRPISYQNIDANGQIQQYTVLPSTQQVASQISFPSHSFLEQFHGTHIEESAQVAPPTQVRTPPPTRKASARKKNQPPILLPNETPPTIISRRMSDHGTWLKRAGQQGSIDATPFNYTPLQITPPEPTSFPSGPLTAPVYPHSQLFWDPNTPPDIAHMALTTPIEGSFDGHSQYASPAYGYHAQLDYSQPTVPAHVFAVPALPRHVPPRPQSARPAEGSQHFSLHTRQHSTLDPSMLVTAQFPDSGFVLQPDGTVVDGGVGARQPYQYQLEAMQREKETRMKKTLRRQATVDSAIIGSAGLDLRKTLTENRAKKAMSVPQAGTQTSIPEPVASYTPLMNQINRTGSPLKRQKSSLQQMPSISPLKNIVPKSVVLTIDESGRATTQVRPVDKTSLRSRPSGSSLKNSSDSDSDSEDLPQSMASSRRGSAAFVNKRPTAISMTSSNDAQDALREIVNAKKQGSSGNLHSLASAKGAPIVTNTVVSSGLATYQAEPPGWNISPTTVSDPDLLTPPADRDAQFFNNTRCICNNSINDEGQVMIQCDSCQKWQHIHCLGLGKEQLPPRFYCIYCTGFAAPAVRVGGRTRAHTTPTSTIAAAYYAPIQNYV